MVLCQILVDLHRFLVSPSNIHILAAEFDTRSACTVVMSARLLGPQHVLEEVQEPTSGSIICHCHVMMQMKHDNRNCCLAHHPRRTNTVWPGFGFWNWPTLPGRPPVQRQPHRSVTSPTWPATNLRTTFFQIRGHQPIQSLDYNISSANPPSTASPSSSPTLPRQWGQFQSIWHLVIHRHTVTGP